MTDDYAELRAALAAVNARAFAVRPSVIREASMTDDYAQLRAALADPAKWQGVDRRGAWVATTENGKPIYVREVIAALLADLDRKTEALRQFGCHPKTCDLYDGTCDSHWRGTDDPGCTCGLRAALRGSGEEAGRG